MSPFLSFYFCLLLFILFILFFYWYFPCYISWCLFLLLHGWSSALFSRTDVLASKFGGVRSPHLFLSSRYCISIYTLGTLYHLSLGVEKNILLSCCTYCECMIMLFLRIGMNINWVLHFIGELKILNIWSFHWGI